MKEARHKSIYPAWFYLYIVQKGHKTVQVCIANSVLFLGLSTGYMSGFTSWKFVKLNSDDECTFVYFLSLPKKITQIYNTLHF